VTEPELEARVALLEQQFAALDHLVKHVEEALDAFFVKPS